MERYKQVLKVIEDENREKRYEYWYGEEIKINEGCFSKVYMKTVGYMILEIMDEKYSCEEVKYFIDEKIEYIKIYKDFIKVKIKPEDVYVELMLYIPIDRNDSKMIEKIKKFKTKYLDSELNKFLKGLV